jgi:hypothetical protein
MSTFILNMRRIVPVLLIACAAMAADAAPAKDSVSPAIAAQVSSLMQKNTDEVNAANAKAAKGLKALLAKNKKDKAASVLIAVKIHKLDPSDADALAILKDVPADQQDLLGQAGEPGKYITDVQAKLIADALSKGKFTAKDWDSLPGTPVEVKATNTSMKCGPMAKGSQWIVIPNPEEKWRETATSPWVNYKGNGSRQIMIARGLSDAGNPIDLKVGTPNQITDVVTLDVSMNTGGPPCAGSIRIKVYEVVPAGE